MEFRIEKCAMLVMELGKREKKTKWIEQSNQESIKILEESIGIGHHQTEMKEKIRKEYLRRTIKRLETKLHKSHQMEKYMEVNNVKYSEPFLRWTKEELRQMNKKEKRNWW